MSNMNIKELYQKEVAPKLKEKFSLKNSFEVPRIMKVVINVGIGRHAKEKAYIDEVQSNIAMICGQKPVLTLAKKSISSFKVRKGMNVGVAVTLRGAKMYDFIDKLVKISIPRVRDFRGLSPKLIDNTGNLSIGFKEQSIFAEIKEDEITNYHGVQVSLATTAKNREQGLELFKLLGFPFKDEK